MFSLSLPQHLNALHSHLPDRVKDNQNLVMGSVVAATTTVSIVSLWRTLSRQGAQIKEQGRVIDELRQQQNCSIEALEKRIFGTDGAIPAIQARLDQKDRASEVFEDGILDEAVRLDRELRLLDDKLFGSKGAIPEIKRSMRKDVDLLKPQIEDLRAKIVEITVKWIESDSAKGASSRRLKQ